MEIKLIKRSSILLLLIVTTLLGSCKSGDVYSEDDKKMYDLIFSDSIVTKKLFELFEINSSSPPKAFKVLVGRHGNFVRVTIFQIFSNFEREQLPAGTFEFNKNLFLYYNGSEILFKRHLSQVELEERFLKSNVVLDDSLSSWKNSNVLQFDKDFQGQLTINSPAISPFDEQVNSVKFK